MNVSEAIHLIKQNGYKLTDKREYILEIFAKENKYLTAKEVLEFMQKSFPSLSFDTIYRNLSLFHELGILEATELNGEKHFRFICSVNDHHHHFICLVCGRTKALQACPMDTILDDLKDYAVEDHKFEVYGTCPSCQ